LFTLAVFVFIFAVKSNTIVAQAAVPANFDAEYYAANNPDVVLIYGTQPEVLFDHYINYGKAEGRYKNLEEETTGEITAELPAEEPVNVIIENLPYDTYVDVDLEKQLVTYYENKMLVMQSPCVTGKTSAGRGTPKGNYSIKAHIPGKTLIGPTWKVWVDYWMRFTDSNIGLHDATWRTAEEFGGDTYINHGSHGCVNLPHEFAKQLFEKVNIGTKVVVH
ncbi:MAG: L,D-transpeptidase, partial [Pseudobutyrivibrio sp.]|nr:L,D-transpeptidase [Pseudobutyrivibrio sp.]